MFRILYSLEALTCMELKYKYSNPFVIFPNFLRCQTYKNGEKKIRKGEREREGGGGGLEAVFSSGLDDFKGKPLLPLFFFSPSWLCFWVC